MKKAQIVLVSITAAFICFLLGFYIGRNNAYGFTLNTTADMTEQTTVPTSTGSATDPSAETTGPTHSKGKINVNIATSEELQMLPGVGERIALNIIAYREEHGPFKSVEDLLNVSLIGEKRLADIRDYITVGD